MKIKLPRRRKPSFAELVYRETRLIPRGKVATYAQIARMIGHPRAARAVGNALNKNPYSYMSSSTRFSRHRDAGTGLGIQCKNLTPCHRVVRSDGTLGGFASGAKKKQALLAKEGVLLKRGKVDLKNAIVGFSPTI